MSDQPENPSSDGGGDGDGAALPLDDEAPAGVEGDTAAAQAAPRPAPEALASRPPSTHVRCFLALNFPILTVRRLAEEVAGLRAPAAEAGLTVRWVPAANLHLTLKFLGQVKRAALEAVASRLGTELAAVRPFEMELRGLGAFPSLEAPRVLWAGVTAQPALLALQEAIEGWMEELGLAREVRPFHPHITLGRVTGPGSGSPGRDVGDGSDRPSKLAAILGERASRGLGTGRATEVVLYESRTLSGGAEYHALGRVPLMGIGAGLGRGRPPAAM